MPLHNVQVTLSITMVVQAEDENHAQDIAEDNWKDCFSDSSPSPRFNVTGEVRRLSDLRDGWCGGCQPYGGSKLIRDLLAEAEKPIET